MTSDADTSATATTAALSEAIAGTGGRLLTRSAWLKAVSPASTSTSTPATRIGLLLVLGIALAYTGISLANTMAMATSDRARDLAALRLAGATRRQVLGAVGAEALLVVTVGAILGLLVAALNLLGMWSALRILSVRTSLELRGGTRHDNGGLRGTGRGLGPPPGGAVTATKAVNSPTQFFFREHHRFP